MKRNWLMPVIAITVGVAVMCLAGVSYAVSPASNKGVQVGPVFLPIGSRSPVAMASPVGVHQLHSPIAGQPSPTPAALKPLIRGLMDQGGYAPAAVIPDLGGVVANATWAQLQPSQTYNQSMTLVHPNPIDDVLKHLQGAGMSNLRIKVRIFSGKRSPTWTLPLSGTFQANDFVCAAIPAPAGCNGGKLTYTYPKWWASQYQAAFDRFEKALGATYDGSPVIGEVDAPRCMMVWTEPMVRSWDVWSMASLMNAGYTNSGDIGCLEQQMVSQATAWPHTRITVNVNPYFDLYWKNGVAARTPDAAATQTIITYCRQTLGAQCVLENDELGRASATPGDPTLWYLYSMMVNAGPPSSYEVDNPGYTLNKPLTLILPVAVGWLANSVEMTNFYLNSQPLSFFAASNLALISNPT